MKKNTAVMICVFIAMTFCLGNNTIENKPEKIFRNIYIEGVDVGGLNSEECRAILNKTYPIDDIVLKYNKKSWTIKSSDINLKYDIEDALNQAIDYTRKNKKLENLKRKTNLLLNNKYVIKLKADYDDDKLNNIIDDISKDVNREVANATLAIENDGTLKKIPSKNGKQLQKEKLKKEILKMVEDKKIKALNLPIKTVIPNLKTSDVNSVDSILGQFSTSFNNETSRGNNIHVAGESSGDIILMPNETYSYNNATGPRVLSRGYKYAPVIVGGRYINGEGGGVCQVSTTIYNAALLAGLEIIEVHNHTYLSHYVSGGRDATVAYGYHDLKFKNPYSHPIYIKNIVGNGAITTKIYGCKKDLQKIYIKTDQEYKKDKIIIKTYRVYLNQCNDKIKEELISTNKYNKR